MTNRSLIDLKTRQFWKTSTSILVNSRFLLPDQRLANRSRFFQYNTLSGGTREGSKKKKECYSVCILGDRWSKSGAPTALEELNNEQQNVKNGGRGRHQETGYLSFHIKRNGCLANEDRLKSWVKTCKDSNKCCIV